MKTNKVFFRTAAIVITAVLFFRWWFYSENLADESNEPTTVGNAALGRSYASYTYSLYHPPATANFKLSEFACHDGTPVPETLYGNVYFLMQNLQALRDYFGLPVFISSGYRTADYNSNTKGAAANSTHVYALAGDIKVIGKSPRQVKEAIEYLISTGKMKEGGIGLYNTFVHYDVRGYKARW